MRRDVLLLSLLVLAAAGSPTLAGQSRPDRLLGIVLRQHINPDAFTERRCGTGRDYALEGGSYSIAADDLLLGVPDEHDDTTAVLAALDSFTVCRVRTRELDATAILTLSDDLIENAYIEWPRGNAPSYDRIRGIVQGVYGEPFERLHGLQYWSSDSMSLALSDRGFYGPATTVILSDSRGCDRYERLMHRGGEPPAPCWKKPVRTEPDEVVTGRPAALTDADLVVAGVAYNADSNQIKRVLGPPTSRDADTWKYPGLQIVLRTGRVHQMTLTSSDRATQRGLRVGDRLGRAYTLYGAPCIANAPIYCHRITPEPDDLGMMLDVKDHLIATIVIGKLFGP